QYSRHQLSQGHERSKFTYRVGLPHFSASAVEGRLWPFSPSWAWPCSSHHAPTPLAAPADAVGLVAVTGLVLPAPNRLRAAAQRPLFYPNRYIEAGTTALFASHLISHLPSGAP
ncbi:MAG: hypothetical protein M3014_01070, partial [Chloroflexota bacterium]|nr:hypothetical protein [Chloroflexota bacterium]